LDDELRSWLEYTRAIACWKVIEEIEDTCWRLGHFNGEVGRYVDSTRQSAAQWNVRLDTDFFTYLIRSASPSIPSSVILPPMTSDDIASTIDATPTVVSLMRHQALGLFWEGLLRSEARERFASLIETTSEKTSIPARAGDLLLEQANNKQFVDQLAIDLVESLGSVFWVEMSEYLIGGTTCRFNAFGAFKRFADKVSFIPGWLWEAPALPCILPESSADSAIDALCRFAMEGARHNAQTRSRPDLPGAAFAPLATELLRERLPGILTVLKPTAP
jgi:hypothetical protein